MFVTRIPRARHAASRHLGEVDVVHADGVARDDAHPGRGGENFRRDPLARGWQERVRVREEGPFGAREVSGAGDDGVAREEFRR